LRESPAVPTSRLTAAIKEREASGQEGAALGVSAIIATMVYAIDDNGRVELAPGVRLQAMHEYRGQGEDGVVSIDPRVTIVLDDRAERFWPLVARVDLDAAKALRTDLQMLVEGRLAGERTSHARSRGTPGAEVPTPTPPQADRARQRAQELRAMEAATEARRAQASALAEEVARLKATVAEREAELARREAELARREAELEAREARQKGERPEAGSPERQ